MRQLPLRSVTVQLIILFVALLALLEIASLGHRYFNRTKALISLEAIRIADRVKRRAEPAKTRKVMAVAGGVRRTDHPCADDCNSGS